METLDEDEVDDIQSFARRNYHAHRSRGREIFAVLTTDGIRTKKRISQWKAIAGVTAAEQRDVHRTRQEARHEEKLATKSAHDPEIQPLKTLKRRRISGLQHPVSDSASYSAEMQPLSIGVGWHWSRRSESVKTQHGFGLF